MKNFFDLQRFADISIGTGITNTVISGTNEGDSITNAGALITIQAGAGNDTVYNTGQIVKIFGGAGDDSVNNNDGKNTFIDVGAGNDTVFNNGSNFNDVINNVTIAGGAGDDLLENFNGTCVSISGGAGNDFIENIIAYTTALHARHVTISGGKGNDTIDIHRYVSGDYSDDYKYKDTPEKNVIQYTQGDGVDVVYGFNSTDTLQLTAQSFTTMKSGEDFFVLFNNGSITLKDAASAISEENFVTISGGSTDDDGDDNTDAEENTWTLSGTTAKYGTSSKTLITVKGVKSLDGISLSGKVVTVAASSLNKKTVTISGTGYTLALDDDVTKTKTTAAGWSVSGTTATYKTKKVTAGYALASNAKSISYSGASGGATKITLSGLKSGTKASYLTLKNNVVTISKNAIGSGKITAKGDGYKFVLGSSGKLTYSGSNATLQGSTGKDTIAGGSKADTIYGGKGNDSINGGAGNDKLFGDAGADKLLGGKGNDTLTGGAGNDTLTGGAGNDVFIYTDGDGNDRITDFSATDTLQIGDGTGTYSTQTSGKNIIVTVGEGNVTLVGAASLSKLNIAGRSPSAGIEVSGKKITLTEDFEDESFSLTGTYSSAVTVDASAAMVDLNIVGNNKANKIIGTENDDTIDGGKGKDTLIGGKGNDILTGGAGNDIFIYSKGDGNDKILDYAEGDLISIKGDTVKSITIGESDAVLNLGSKKKITLTGAADKVISYEVDGKEKTYSVVDKYVTFNSNGTSATLKKTYPAFNFTPNLYSEYANLATINASAVTHDLNITGNNKANKITGGKGNDSLLGEKGNDTLIGGVGDDTLVGGKGNDQLWGGDGEDTFLYATGDGNDKIFDYDSTLDKIILTSGTVDNVATDRNNNVIFKIGTGQIVLANAVDKYAEIIDSSGKVLKQYNP